MKMKVPGIIKAPFTQEQVDNLNQYQKLGIVHEFTCPQRHEDRTLIATQDGWICPHCDYTQNWCHEFMTDVQKIKDNWNQNFGNIQTI